MSTRHWEVPFTGAQRILDGTKAKPLPGQWALIVLNQPFSRQLLDILWHACTYRIFADGGSNRARDALGESWKSYKPDLITGDFDSIRPEVKQQYMSLGVQVVEDNDLDATDLMKCFNMIQSLEKNSNGEYSVIILGGLSGRLDQTVHTMSYLNKLRKLRRHVYVATDDNLAWVLDSGEHRITLDRTFLGPTCGLLPVGVTSTTLSMEGLKWNWTNHESGFEGDVSTSNWLADDHIWIKTTNPIWWSVELRLPSS
ncbi:thiamine pyrophosphokinase [Serendipita vermifera]|nr:thiamine pyrophosphokinase [Serendipita vermifera]